MKIIFLAILLAFSFGLREADRVSNVLPGCTDDSFRQFSGYLDITDTKKFHYVLVESQNDPENDPLLFWFNGGPGCSSMIGFIQEHGPCVFLEDSDTAPQDNPYSWNKFANIVYLESPAGVGYNHFEEVFKYDDDNVSYENLKAVQEFFAAFPEYKQHDFYLSGESYAGIYIPYLALRIDEYNAQADDKINLKGFMIGNGVTNWKYDTLPAFIKMAYTHGLIGLDLQDRIEAANCNFTEVGAPPLSDECELILEDFDKATEHIYPYDFYRPTEDYYDPTKMTVSEYFQKESKAEVDIPYGSFSRLVKNNPKVSNYGFFFVDKYMNEDSTKAALNIPLEFNYEKCSDIHYTKLARATQWIYPRLKGKYRMLHYSGTTDGVVSTVGTEGWLQDLGWKVKKKLFGKGRKPWFSEPLIIGGYSEYREGNLDFITIHGTGHKAPQWKRQPSFLAISTWLQGKDLPRK